MPNTGQRPTTLPPPPATTLISILMTIPGITALIIGDHASRVFSEIGGSVFIRIIGLAFTLGGIFTILSVLRQDKVFEGFGSVLTAMGSALFGSGVFLVQGTLGIVSGALSLSVTVAFMYRVWGITRGPVPRE